jgi:TonB-dependent starch-binding outer membrane protein SusC
MLYKQITLSGCKRMLKHFLLLSIMFAFQYNVHAQEKQISGTVYDLSGTTLPGVNVIVKGTTIGTITDINGYYSIIIPLGTDLLSYSFVGYLEQTVSIGNQSTINVYLKEDILEMDEVIVVGYGTQRKSDVTGSITSVSGESLQNLPSARADEAMQGKAAGVMVLQNSGQPGSSPVIRVRGLATVNGGTPLVVIDGISGGSIADVNPADIESIEILKDAASQTIYGSAGGNGVILITTKKGSAGKIKTRFDMYAGVQEPWKKQLDIADAQQYAAIYNQYQEAKNLPTYFALDQTSSQYLNPITNDALQSTNWVDEIFRAALVQNYNLSVSGGNSKANFFMGANYNSEEGTVKKTSNDRFSFRLNSEIKLLDRITIGENFSITQNNYSGQDERNEYNSPLSTAVQMLPLVPVYAADESGNFAYREAGLSSNIKNPLAQIEYNNNYRKTTSLFGNAFVRATIIQGLTAESRIGLSYSPSEYRKFEPVHTIGAEDSPSASQSKPINQYDNNTSSNFSWQWQNYLTYNITIAEKNNITAVAGFESGYSIYKFTDRSINSINLETSAWKGFDSIDDMNILREKEVETAGYAYFARLNYDYDGIYLLQANFRRDYSSVFGPNNRVGNFPSASLGIKFSEYNFIKNLGFIDFGKIRIGYGQTGNSDIQPFLYLNSMGVTSMNSYPFGGQTLDGAALLTAANPDLKWETVVTQNIGIDLRFMASKLSITADVFSRRNKDMLLRKSVPLTVGYMITDAGNELGDANLDTRPLVNYGTLNNRGFEAAVSYREQIGKLKFDISANITRAVTTIDDIGDPLYAGSGRSLSNVTQTKNGAPVSAFYGYKTDGIYTDDDFLWYLQGGRKWTYIAPDPNGGSTVQGTDVNGNPVTYTLLNTNALPGNLKFMDTNNDKAINALDMVQIGDPNPDFVYGFTANFEYQNFDFNLFFQGSYGNDIYNMLKVNLYTMNNGGLNVSNDLISSYIPAIYDASDRTKMPSVVAEARNTGTGIFRMDGNMSSSDFYVEDGSYLRLKNIQLGYTLPQQLSQKAKIERLRIYISAKNLFTFTNYTGFDPEVGETTILERGFDRGTYPQSKLYTIGVNVSF